jgi:hypothetical protein
MQEDQAEAPPPHQSDTTQAVPEADIGTFEMERGDDSSQKGFPVGDDGIKGDSGADLRQEEELLYRPDVAPPPPTGKWYKSSCHQCSLYCA